MKKKKRPFTLLEIIIVIFLIGLIGSAIGYNMKGSIEKGRAFKTERAIEQITDILSLEMAQGATIDQIVNSPAAFLDTSGMVKNAAQLLKDGWGGEITVKKDGNGNLKVRSANLLNYRNKKRTKLKEANISTDDVEDLDEPSATN
jgi:type II secretory pathway pseudopilin PulG